MYIILSCGFVVKHEVVRDDARTEDIRKIPKKLSMLSRLIP